MNRRILGIALACLLACVSSSLAGAAPGPRAAIPREAAALARTLVVTKTDLARAIDAWRAGGALRMPPEVTLDALYDQRIELLLATRPQMERATLRRVPQAIALGVRTNLAAKRELWRLT